MTSLNEFLHSGDTVLKIIQNYADALAADAVADNNPIDRLHSEFLNRMEDLLIHNDFLTYQSQRILEFYQYMADLYPYLAFTYRGRIKSLIRAEEKFNGYIVEHIYDHYTKTGEIPSVESLKQRVSRFHDLIAYRIVISMPKCHLKPGETQDETEIRYLYDIANRLPAFLSDREFTVQPAGIVEEEKSPLLAPAVRPYYRDYVTNLKGTGYRSLHVTFFDDSAKCFMEVQLRTKSMDDFAEIGRANHENYEKTQERSRARRKAVPYGASRYFDEAYERIHELQNLELNTLDVNMFSATNNYLINDGCGLFRGRMILPFEHLSRFQNDLIAVPQVKEEDS